MIILPIVVSLYSIFFALFLIRNLKKISSNLTIEGQKVIKERVTTFLKREYKRLGVVTLFFFFIIWLVLGIKSSFGFLLGAFFSILVSFIGTMISTEAPKLERGLAASFLVSGLALLAISLFYYFTKDLKAMIALGFGCSLVSVFAKFGEEIFGIVADLFETYVVAVVVGMVLGELLFSSPIAIFLPLFLASLGILASIISTIFVKLGKKKSLIGASLIFALGTFFLIFQLAPKINLSFLNLYSSVVLGLLVTLFIILISDFYASKKFLPVKTITQTSQSTQTTNIISTLAMGSNFSLWIILMISITILISYQLAGLYSLATCVISMLSLSGLIIALDTISNSAKAITKGYAISSATLLALVLFFTFSQELTNLGTKIQFLLEDPRVLFGLFIGGAVTYYFAGFSLAQTGKVKEMSLLSLLPIICPLLIGFLLGVKALGGLLIGSIMIGFFLAFLILSQATEDTPPLFINSMIKVPNVVALLIIDFLV